MVLYNGEKVLSRYDDDGVKNGWKKACLPTGQRKKVAYEKVSWDSNLLQLEIDADVMEL